MSVQIIGMKILPEQDPSLFLTWDSKQNTRIELSNLIKLIRELMVESGNLDPNGGNQVGSGVQTLEESSFFHFLMK